MRGGEGQPTRVLFVTRDGPQLSYLQSLFLPIFEGLAPHGYRFDVLQFRWGEAERTRAVVNACARAGVGYEAVIERRLGGLGSLATALIGSRHVERAARRFGSHLLMPRDHFPALAAMLAGGGRRRPLLFDADGLPADERVDFRGLKSGSPFHRLLLGIERAAVRRSPVVLTRTRAAADMLAARAGVAAERFHPVANGRDPALFHPGDPAARAALRARLGIAADAPVLAYAGSVGPQYRFERVASLFAAMRAQHAGARLLMLSGEPDAARAGLGASADGAVVMRVEPGDVPAHLRAADVGLAFRQDRPSMRAVAPVKLGEYLLCGLPVVGAAAIGDTAGAIDAGVFADDRAGDGPLAERILGDWLPRREAMRQAARAVGLADFSLDRSVRDYRAALDAFGKSPAMSATSRGPFAASE